MRPLLYAVEHLLQFSLPGAPEILIFLLMMLMMVLPIALVIILVVGIIRLMDTERGDDRVDELERRVDELQSELEAERTDGDDRSTAPNRNGKRE